MIKLLIADDEPLVLIGIKSMIKWESFGIEICGTAMNGQSALEMIREYSPELVITDIKMPKACPDLPRGNGFPPPVYHSHQL